MEDQVRAIEPGLAATPAARRLLTSEQVRKKLGGISPTTLWHWQRFLNFPRALEAGGKKLSYEDEIDAWLASRPRQKLKGDPDLPAPTLISPGRPRKAAAADAAPAEKPKKPKRGRPPRRRAKAAA